MLINEAVKGSEDVGEKKLVGVEAVLDNIRKHQEPAPSIERKVVQVKNDEGSILEQACQSQYKSRFVERLKSDKRYEDFLALIEACGESGMSLSETRKAVSKRFSSYFRGEKGLDARTFNDLLEWYPEISEAFYYEKKLTMRMVRRHATVLAKKTDSMRDIEIYNRMYDDTGISIRPEKDDNSSGDGGVPVFNIIGLGGGDVGSEQGE